MDTPVNGTSVLLFSTTNASSVLTEWLNTTAAATSTLVNKTIMNLCNNHSTSDPSISPASDGISFIDMMLAIFTAFVYSKSSHLSFSLPSAYDILFSY